MNRTTGWLAFAGAALMLEGSTCRAALIAGFDFQTTSSGGTAVLAATNTPTVFNANVGSGTLYMNGTNGSSSWLQHPS